ncbi:MAG: glycosidase [Candidatus Mariimomonas ferrooxydans]
MRLKRYQGNPILKPKVENEWESRLVFNPAAIYHNGLFHLFYRAMGEDNVSRIGYAVSSDGFNFYRLDKPVFVPESRLETRGCEDPRIVMLQDKFYMTYTAYSEEGVRVALASTSNFINWERFGVILPDIDDKDAVLFPEKLMGKYVLFHRPMDQKPLSIWIAYSEDLSNWYGHKKVMAPRPGNWDGVTIGASCPALKTEKGWLLIYHGVDEDGIYRLGLAIFDLKDPSKLLYRHPEPILEPQKDYELRGERNQVVFACGVCEVEGTYFIYYGGADRVVCVATIGKEELLKVFNQG